MNIPEAKHFNILPPDYVACIKRSYGIDTGASGRTIRGTGTILKKETKPMEYREAKSRLDELLKITDEDFDAMKLEEMRSYNEEVSSLDKFIQAEDVKIQERKKTAQKVANGAGTVIRSWNNNNNNVGGNNVENINVNNNDLEIRSFQKFLAGEFKTMNETEQRALDISGAGAVLPVQVYNKLITENKYSDLLHRATVINEGKAGTIKIPIASNTAASWKVENSEEIAGTSIEAAPTLTNLSLGGFELMRLMTMSAATASMSADGFMSHMLELISGEVVETLEDSFINGDGVTEPITGLAELTYTTNQVLTDSAATPIAPEDIAKAISLLPQKYARNAVILMNAATAYEQVALFKGTSEYAYSMADGAQRFMGKEIIVSEHVPDDEIYVLDPKELYVRFAQPISVEADKSSGFRSASIDLRALCVVDAKYNTKAVVRVGLGS